MGTPELCITLSQANDDGPLLIALPEVAVVGVQAPVLVSLQNGDWRRARILVACQEKRRNPDSRRVSAVITSCGRQDLLERTLDSSFFSFNSYPIGQFIVVEDGAGCANEPLVEKYRRRKILWLATGKSVGQITAIDYAYSLVNSPYIFHMEDDWEFYAPGFIERSLLLLEALPNSLQVWLRAFNDTNHRCGRKPRPPQGSL